MRRPLRERFEVGRDAVEEALPDPLLLGHLLVGGVRAVPAGLQLTLGRSVDLHEKPGHVPSLSALPPALHRRTFFARGRSVAELGRTCAGRCLRGYRGTSRPGRGSDHARPFRATAPQIPLLRVSPGVHEWSMLVTSTPEVRVVGIRVGAARPAVLCLALLLSGCSGANAGGAQRPSSSAPPTSAPTASP